ncbi:MAG: UDP-N-acetylmuramoyl-tripeptide--D-alanyl-D-alanine ligase [Bacteroidia bacterium]
MKNIAELYEIFLKHPVVSTDTRTITDDCIFFALKGANFNGNAFAGEALSKGAAFAVIDEEAFKNDDRYILVQDVLTTLQQLAHYHRTVLGERGLRVIGLTGSNGKTTTKELVARVLSKKYETHFTAGNLNNHIGVPLTLLQLKPYHEIAVIEMGANHQGEIAELSAIADPDAGMITNIGLAHLEGFGGPEGVLKGKTELFRHLEKKKGKVFVLADDKRLLELSKNFNRILYGTSDEATVKGNVISANPFIHFNWSFEGRKHTVKSHLVGAYNLPNMLAAVAIGLYFEISPEEICEAISSYIPTNNRSQLEHRGSNQLILDCYNANPSSVSAALENFAGIEAANKYIFLGDMFELGESSHEEHQKIATLISLKLPDAKVYLVGKHFYGTTGGANIYRRQSAAEVIEEIKNNIPQQALILIKGSRGMKMEQIAEIFQ